MTQRCPTCGQTKPAEHFALLAPRKHRRPGTRDTYCRPCRKAYRRDYYVTIQKGVRKCTRAMSRKSPT